MSVSHGSTRTTQHAVQYDIRKLYTELGESIHALLLSQPFTIRVDALEQLSFQTRRRHAEIWSAQHPLQQTDHATAYIGEFNTTAIHSSRDRSDSRSVVIGTSAATTTLCTDLDDMPHRSIRLGVRTHQIRNNISLR